MSDIRPEPVDWLWEPYIPSGAITLIQGDGGTGKTTASLAITAALTKGEALPGGNTLIPSNVIIQNAEDSYTQTIRPRLETLGADCRLIHVIDEEEQALSLSDERIEEAIARTNAKLLLLDPIQAYFYGANMNSANGVRPLMKKLGMVAARYNCAVLLVGHLNKKGGKSQYAGLGSIDIFAAARSVLTVGNTNIDENVRAIVHNKSNLAPAGKPQAFGLDPISGFSWMGDYDITIEELLGRKRKPESRFAKARRFIETILENGPVLAVDVFEKAEEQDISISTLNRAKEALGVISVKQGEQWFWVLPIEVECTEVNQHSQHSQGSQNNGQEVFQIAPLTNLSNLRNMKISKRSALTNLPGQIIQEGC
jgi:KaiC/GvpD/RAD55 family RecA-like ATPase